MQDNLKLAICEKIKELRKTHSYSQDDIAIALNMEQNTYSRMERGETKLDIERLQQIAIFYEISIFHFLDGIPPPENKRLSKFRKNIFFKQLPAFTFQKSIMDKSYSTFFSVN
jgi:transcriptional regulator with XRE-family HTH domain